MSNQPVQKTATATTVALNQTEIGTFFLIYKNYVVAAVAAILVGGAVFGGVYYYKQDVKEKMSLLIYQLEREGLVKYAKGDIDGEKVISLFEQVASKGMTSQIVPTAVTLADEMIKKNDEKRALDLLKRVETSASGKYQKALVHLRLAVCYENIGEETKAIDSLKIVAAQNIKLLSGKSYLDLGRLYLKAGNKEQAKASFEYVVKMQDALPDFVKLATSYLEQI